MISAEPSKETPPIVLAVSRVDAVSALPVTSPVTLPTTFPVNCPTKPPVEVVIPELLICVDVTELTVTLGVPVNP